MTVRANLPDGAWFVKSENMVIDYSLSGNISMYKYLTADDLLIKAEEFLSIYAN